MLHTNVWSAVKYWTPSRSWIPAPDTFMYVSPSTLGCAVSSTPPLMASGTITLKRFANSASGTVNCACNELLVSSARVMAKEKERVMLRGVGVEYEGDAGYEGSVAG